MFGEERTKEFLVENIFTYFTKYYKDLLCILLLIFIFAVCAMSLWGYFGNVFYDNGREAYLPELILEGKVLYKDIFALYNPLSYQINAVLYYLFGHSLYVLYNAGAINAFLIIIALYLIHRQFIDKWYSVVFCLTIMFLFIFNSKSCVNYIFPYAYAFVYALSTMLYSCLFGLLYLKYKKKTYYIVLSFIMLGLSIANKPEFMFCIIPLIGLLIYTKATRKTYLSCISSLLFPSLLSWGILFFQKYTFSDMYNYGEFIWRFFNTGEQIFYNQQIVNFWNQKGIFLLVQDTLMFATILLTPMFAVKLFKRGKLYTVPALFLFSVLIFILPLLGKFFARYNLMPLAWSGIMCFVIMCYSIKNKDNDMIFLSTMAIVSLYRCKFIVLGGLKIYLCILPLTICFIYFIKHIRSTFFSDLSKMIFTCYILLLGLNVQLFNVYSKRMIYAPIVAQKPNDIMYSYKSVVEVFNDTVNWVLENTNVDDTVLVLPEGVFLNYITKRNTNLKYYHLIPNHISALNEDVIINDLQKNLPDYFIINNTSYELYGKAYMCKDFGFAICDLIRKNYEYKKNFRKITKYKGEQQEFYMSIYKLKKHTK